MGKANVLTGLKIGSIENLIALKMIKGAGGTTPTYEDRTATGNPVVFTTNFAQNAKTLTVDFEPKQNLNGFDHPWGGGAGKNLVGDSLLTYGKTIGTNGAVTDYTSQNRCSTVNPILIDNTQSYVISASASDIRVIYAVYNGSTFVRRVANAVSGTVLNVAGGDRVRLCFYVYDASRASGTQYDYRKVSPTDDEIQFEQGSTPTAYERYDNLCPIEGLDGIKILRTEENLFGELADSTYFSNGVIFRTRGNAIVATRTERPASSSSHGIRYVSVPNTLEPGNYYYFGKTHSDGVNLSDDYIWDTTSNARAKKWDGTPQNASDFGDNFGSLYEFKIESGHSYTMCCRVRASAELGSEHIFVPTILKADTQATAVSVDFGSTQYGGTLDVKTGVLTIDTIKIAVSDANKEPSASNGWRTDTNANRIGFAISTAILPKQSNSLDVLCNIGYASSVADGSSGFAVSACSLYKGSACMYFRYCVPKSITNVDDAYTYLKNNNCEFTVPLETPLTYQLTEQQVALLEGENVIVTDGDTINVTYQVKV